MDLEAQESEYTKAYRKKFPKGKDWKTPPKNPHGFCGLDEDSYHGMEIIAVDIEKYEQAQTEITRLQLLVAEELDKNRKLEFDLYFITRNNKIENNPLKVNFDKTVTALNQLLQEDKNNEYIKQVLVDIGIAPNNN
jgi:hypothetical protein